MSELVVDAHVHLWNPQQFRLTWLDHEPALNKPFGLAEYSHQSAGSRITGMVYAEVDAAPHYALLEAQWAASLAVHDARLQGIVAAAPVENGDRMGSYLMALQSIGPLIKGVRRNPQGEKDETFCLEPDFVRGIQIVAEYGFTFDICIRHHQLPMVVVLVRQCPDTRLFTITWGSQRSKTMLSIPGAKTWPSLPRCQTSGVRSAASSQKPIKSHPEGGDSTSVSYQ